MFTPNLSPPSILGFALLAGLFVLSAKRVFGHLAGEKQNYPPGPKGVPIFGMLFRFFTATWSDFDQWGKKYGDVVYMEAFGQGILLLNSHKATVDLLDRRGGIYSDRPALIVAQGLLTRGLLLAAAPDNELWRKMRRAGNECMNRAAVKKYNLILQKEALLFTENLLQKPKGWYHEVYRTTASGLLSALYDMPPTLSPDDPVITKLDDFDKFLMHAVYPGTYLVEFFTWMKYLPAALAPWKRKANEQFTEFSKFFLKLLRDVEKQMGEGDEKPGLVCHTIRQRERLGLNDTEASWIPASFANGAIANAETLLWLFPAMVAYPEKQRKCQEELDAVVGRSRLPTFEDRDHLPYVTATVRELLRWRPTAPLGAQHVTKQDDWYEGYFIPKGTHCFAHIWYMNRDRQVYGADADDFNPDRFIGPDGKLLPAPPDTRDGHTSYGFGPRVCPGRYFANDTLYIIFARLLWAATISPVIDKQTGKPSIPDVMATDGDGLTMRPPPFELVVKPRFAEAAEMISQAKEVLE